MQTAGGAAVSWFPWPLELILPSRCVSCGASGPTACDGCLRLLDRLQPPLCGRCGAPTAWPVQRCRECAGRRLGFATARAAVRYDGTARVFVRAWKERGLRRFAAVAAELVAEVVARPAADVITYIPPDGDRSLRRGHHPAAALARELARTWQQEAAPLLVRTRMVARQTGLARAQRRRNVREAFAAGLAGTPASVVLVDDVYTTGATVGAAAAALRRAGARRVDVVTFARAGR
jgi:ComF family protein